MKPEEIEVYAPRKKTKVSEREIVTTVSKLIKKLSALKRSYPKQVQYGTRLATLYIDLTGYLNQYAKVRKKRQKKVY